MQEAKERHILYIDILKAIACICVLVGHVINGIIKAGISVSGLLIHLNTYVYLFHVPCFFFASGYLYENKQIKNWKEYALLVAKKLLVLGLPYFACTGLYVAISSFFSSEMNPNTSYPLHELLNIWKAPIAQYWYLYALMLLFIFVPAVELIFKKIDKRYLLIGFVLLILWHFNILWVDYITQYAYLFFLGVIWNISNGSKWQERLLQHAKCARGGVYLAESLMLYLIYAVVVRENILTAETENILKNVVTLFMVITMVRLSFTIAEIGNYIKSFLLWVSKYSLYIYLFHTWFSGTLRVLLRRLGITNCWTQTLVGIAGGLIGPILLAKFIKRVPVFRFWIEPLTVIRREN